MLQEWSQLCEGENQPCISMMASKLTRIEKCRALRVLFLTKKKRCGKIKERVVADGSKQRAYMDKESVALSMVHLESIITTLVTDTYEGRGVQYWMLGVHSFYQK